MSVLLKLLPLLGIGYLGYVNSDLLSKAAEAVRQVQVDTTTQIEVQNIGRALRMYYVENNSLPVKHFHEFLVEAMAQNNGKKMRNPTRDMWDTPYRLETRPPKAFAVLSAGPDKRWGTSDDICGVFGVEDLGGTGSLKPGSSSSEISSSQTLSETPTPTTPPPSGFGSGKSNFPSRSNYPWKKK